jgi:hypothetical protein
MHTAASVLRPPGAALRAAQRLRNGGPAGHYAGFEREPFSNSPDPGFLLGTRQHATCLQELEISLRLRRGLNLVTGDIGTGKTTLCRSLLRAFAEDKDADVHLLLDPHFDSSEEFLQVILASVTGRSPDTGMGLWALKETLKQQLFRLGLVEKRLVVLIIDEGQKIAPDNLEILREMLNYETNTAKLLQIVLFGQRELEPVIDAMPNLADRIKRAPAGSSPCRPRDRGHDRAAWPCRRDRPRRCASPHGRLECTWPPVATAKTLRLCHLAMLETLVADWRAWAWRGPARLRSVPSPTPLRRWPWPGCRPVPGSGLPVAFSGRPRPGDARRAGPHRKLPPPHLRPAPDVDASPGISTAACAWATTKPKPRSQDPAQCGRSLLPPRDSGPTMRKAVETGLSSPGRPGGRRPGKRSRAPGSARPRPRSPHPYHWSRKLPRPGGAYRPGPPRPATWIGPGPETRHETRRKRLGECSSNRGR